MTAARRAFRWVAALLRRPAHHAPRRTPVYAAFRCDGPDCEEFIDSSDSMAEAESLARDEGWHFAGGRALCPDCQEARR